ncbi:MAG: hypothetical protein IPL96_17810 [Holophagaceae bacterium]|nr:hypothetical protein [Holophagaceae bacterium]
MDRNELCIRRRLSFYCIPDAPRNIHDEVLLLNFDPRNATLEAEYYSELILRKWTPVKPLLCFWQMFDNSPLNANVWLGLKFRAMLAPHIPCKRCGKNVKFFTGVAFSFGYNVSIDDDTIVHRFVLLDDRAPSPSARAPASAKLRQCLQPLARARGSPERAPRRHGHRRLRPGGLPRHGVGGGTKVGEVEHGGHHFGLFTKDLDDYNVAIGMPAHAKRLKPDAPDAVAARHPELKR